MKKFYKLLLPMATCITILSGSMIPLVSCNTKIGGKDDPETEDATITFTIDSTKGHFQNGSTKSSITFEKGIT